MVNEKIEYLNLDLLHPFENNPFQSVDEIEYDELRGKKSRLKPARYITNYTKFNYEEM